MKPWLKIAITFVVGLLLGSAATGIYIHHCFARTWAHGGNSDHLVKHLSSKLNLNADQKEKLQGIFKEEKPAFDAVRTGTEAKLKAIRDKVNTRIRLILSPDQQDKFDGMMARWEAKHKDSKDWHLPGMPPGPPFHSDRGDAKNQASPPAGHK
jgi:hypothetical protein